METPATGIAGAGNSSDRVGKPISSNLAPDSPKVEREICLCAIPPARKDRFIFWEKVRVHSAGYGAGNGFDEGSGRIGIAISDALIFWPKDKPLVPEAALLSADGLPKRVPIKGYGGLRNLTSLRAAMFGEACCKRLPGANSGAEMLSHAARLLALLAQAAANPEQPGDVMPLDVDALDKAAAAMVPALIEAAVNMAKGGTTCS